MPHSSFTYGVLGIGLMEVVPMSGDVSTNSRSPRLDGGRDLAMGL